MRLSYILKSKILISLILFVLVFCIYFLSSPGETYYNYFALLSNSFINGKLYLYQNPPWLNELVPMDGKFYVVYPPMPAVLLMPLALFFGINTPQTILSLYLGALNVVLVYLLFLRLKFSERTSILMSLFFGFGTNHWYLASVGSSWFIAHIVALFFLLLALLETFGKQRLILIGLLIGSAFWARTPVIFTTVFFYIIFWKKFLPVTRKNLYNFFLINIGIILFIILDAYYNFLRFGNFSPFAPYQLIPNLDKDPMFKDGFMSIIFIPRHIDALIFRLPKFIFEPPFMIPSIYATALWFVSPLIVYVFKFKKSLLSFASWSGVLLPLVVISMWAGIGYSQFGYRFAQDFMPFLLILIAMGIGKKPGFFAYILLVVSILINAWGTVLINKFNIFYL